jgi:two-component system, OmpR family, phosphate regulon sensor histidine kinase PhoR
MKLNRTTLFIAGSSVALLIVLFIQINWIFETAEIKENLFNEKAAIILSRTTQALSADPQTGKNLETFTGENEKRKIDSLLTHFMNYYNFHPAYSYEVIRALPPIPYMLPAEASDLTQSGQSQKACHDKTLDELEIKNGWKLKLDFPNKEAFLKAEMGMPFITSVVLLLIVLLLYWRTARSLITEKKIAEHTTDFLNNMTHEIKTPLTNIALAGKMIARNSTQEQEAKIKHYSAIILEENEKLRLQVEQMLSMTALERGEIPIQKTTLDFHQLVNDAIKPICIQIENKNGELKINFEAQKFIVSGDKTHLANAVSNLVENAIKYSGEKPQITIQTHNSNGDLIVSISDKGIGIEKDHQKKVFDKYFRVPTGNVHAVRGFGLGLAYTKKIIELHGGNISLTSEKAIGTTFTFNLPDA